MSNEPAPTPEGLPPEIAALLRQLLGPAADDAIASLGSSGFDIGEMLRAAGMPPDLSGMSHLFAQAQRLFANPSAGPVNWELAHDVARQTASADGSDPSLTDKERREITEALTVAELWLEPVTGFGASGALASALSRAEWVEATLAAWKSMAEPVAASVADALGTAMSEQAAEHPGLPGIGAQASGLMRAMGGSMFGMQLGQAVGALSREALGLSDIGVPLTASPAVALLPANVAQFAEGLDTPLEEVRLFLALREAAHARLFAAAPWLRGHLLSMIESYARGITIDTGRITDAVSHLDPSDMQGLRDALSSGIFALDSTDEQERALTRLEASLALVEGWVDEVCAAAAAGHLPDAESLREMMRRRRAAGGPAEHTFATLVGLELRPRKAREAAELWAGVLAELGTAGRESLWQHPDVMPSPEDLDEPATFLARREAERSAESEVDDAIAKLLGPDPAGGGAGDGEPGDGGEPPQS